MEFISLTHACTFRFNSLLNELRFYVPPDTKQVISETFFPANLLVKFWIPSSATTEGLHDASVAVLIIMGWGWIPALRLNPSAETLDPNTETLRRSNALQRQCSSAAQPYTVPSDALHQVKSPQMLQSCANNRRWKWLLLQGHSRSSKTVCYLTGHISLAISCLQYQRHSINVISDLLHLLQHMQRLWPSKVLQFRHLS